MFDNPEDQCLLCDVVSPELSPDLKFYLNLGTVRLLLKIWFFYRNSEPKIVRHLYYSFVRKSKNDEMKKMSLQNFAIVVTSKKFKGSGFENKSY